MDVTPARIELAASPGAGVATRDDHVVVSGATVTILEVAASGFEVPTATPSGRVAAALRAASAANDAPLADDVVAAIVRTAVAEIDEEAAAWIARVRLEVGAAVISWLGGIEVHLVRGGRAFASTRGHRLAAPGMARVLTRGLGDGYPDRELDMPARWPVSAGDRLIAVSTGIALSLTPDVVAAAARADEPAAAVLAVAQGRGFVVSIDVA